MTSPTTSSAHLHSREATIEQQPAATTTEAITILVITYSPGPVLEPLIESLAAATERECRIILVDNGSTDGVPEAAAKKHDNVEFLPAGSNLGYGRAANLGAARADTEWLIVANQDLEFSPGSLDVLLQARERWPRAGSLGPAILTPDGSLYPSARALPSLGRGIGHALCGWWWPSNPWTSSYRQERGTPVERSVGWLSGSCLLVRAEAFADISGFDPSYFMYFEDLDLGERLGTAGWLNVYVPDSVVTHQGGQATERNRSAMVTEHHRSAYRYLSRHYSGLRWLPVRIALKIGLAGRNALSQLVFAVGEGAKPTRNASVLRRRR